jgi:hypothetical protein
MLIVISWEQEIFTEREEFKRRIFRNIQGELDQFGLKIYNANVKELRDAPQSSYFESLSRKAHEGAINQARIDVAEAQRKGNVGEAARQGEQNREIAKINAETAVQKTERDSEKAKAEATLATRKTAFNRDVNIAQIEATRATEARDEELRKEVETKRAQTELERLRATDVVKATIARESKQQAADAKNYEEQARSNAGMHSAFPIALEKLFLLHRTFLPCYRNTILLYLRKYFKFTLLLCQLANEHSNQLFTASRKQQMPMPTRSESRPKLGTLPRPRTPRPYLSDSKKRLPV